MKLEDDKFTLDRLFYGKMWNKMKGKWTNKEEKVWFMEAQKSTQHSYSAKHLPVRAFTIRGPLWSSSIFTSYQPWRDKNWFIFTSNNIGSITQPSCYGAFFKGWHQWQPTLINTNLSMLIEVVRSPYFCTRLSMLTEVVRSPWLFH